MKAVRRKVNEAASRTVRVFSRQLKSRTVEIIGTFMFSNLLSRVYDFKSVSCPLK